MKWHPTTATLVCLMMILSALVTGVTTLANDDGRETGSSGVEDGSTGAMPDEHTGTTGGLSGEALPAGTRAPSANALFEVVNGTGNSTADLFGLNVTTLDDVNGDSITDLAVGAPGEGNSSGAVFIYFGGEYLFGADLNATSANVTIRGEENGSLFGWDLCDAGDFNGDGVGDLAVGGPGLNGGGGGAYLFYGGSGGLMAGDTPELTAGQADVLLHILTSSAGFGNSVSTAGDFDDDGFNDVIVGASRSDRAYVFFGTDAPILYPDLWDYPADAPQPIDFTSGAYNDVGANQDLITWDRLAGDDGWDCIDAQAASDELYGRQAISGDFAYYYGPPETGGADGDNVAGDGSSRLEVQLGPSHRDGFDAGTGHPNNNNPGLGWDSSAWGIEINLTTPMVNAVNAGGRVFVGFDYQAIDTHMIYDPGGDGTEEESHVKSRFHNSSGAYLLGWDLGGNMPTGNSVFFHSQPGVNNGWGPYYDRFSWDVTQYIEGTGPYYWDFGGMMGSGGGGMGNDEGLRVYFDNITMMVTQMQVLELEGPVASSFGTAVAGGGDFDDDGYGDVVVGAPMRNNRGGGMLYTGRDRVSIPPVLAFDEYDAMLAPTDSGERLGASAAFIGDFDNDGMDDVALGAPTNMSGGAAAGAVKVFLGHTGMADVYPNLWENASDTPQPVDFSTSVHNDVPGTPDSNTWGAGAGDDGWDWIDYQTDPANVYGGNGPQDIAHIYAAWEEGGADAQGICGDNSSRLEIQIGPSHNDAVDQPDPQLGGWPNTINTNANQNNWRNDWDSAAWGIEINITPQVASFTQLGADAVVGFDYEAIDAELLYGTAGTEEDCYIKSRFGDTFSMNYLGWDLGGTENPLRPSVARFTGSNANPWGPEYGSFSWDVSNHISTNGTYYLDFGCKFGGGTQGDNEGMRAYFDNITFRIKYTVGHDLAYEGTSPGDLFGSSVSSGDVDGDGMTDLIVGSPGNSTVTPAPAYSQTGAFFVFYGSSTPATLTLAPSADHFTPGRGIDRGLGGAVHGIDDMNGDGKWEVLVGETGRVDEAGQAYVFTITSTPVVQVNYPNGGEVVSGVIDLRATATDDDDDINNNGVRFSITADQLVWLPLGYNATHDGSDVFHLAFNTRTFPDGVYWLKATVADRLLNVGSDMSDDYFTIDNPDAPNVTWASPTSGDVVEGIVPLHTLASDADDNIDPFGVVCFHSNDSVNWMPIDNAESPVDIGGVDTYEVLWNTTTVDNGPYYLKAMVNDTTGLSAENITNVTVYNTYRPDVFFIFPTGGEVLSGVVHITLNATDQDENILPQGVSLAYSSDFSTWTDIGSTGSPESDDIYGFDWDTTKVPRGSYSLRAIVTDEDGLYDQDGTGLVTINQDAARPPVIDLQYPLGGETLVGIVEVKAEASDVNGDITPAGVTFSHRPFGSADAPWTAIGSDPGADAHNVYATPWDTTKVDDGYYIVKAEVKDASGNSAEALSGPVAIHNTNTNPPVALLAWPEDGTTLSGEAELIAFGFDLDDNLADARFEYSSDGTTWEPVNEEAATGTAVADIAANFNGTIEGKVTATGLNYSHSFTTLWNTTGMEVGDYSVRVTLFDLTGMEDTTPPVEVHIDVPVLPAGPPQVQVTYPAGGEVIFGEVELKATATDPDGDLDLTVGVRFYVISPGESVRKHIATSRETPGGDEFTITWNTTGMDDATGYVIVAVASDLGGREGEGVSGEFAIDNSGDGPGPDGQDGDDVTKTDKGGEETGMWPWLLLVIIAIAVVLVLVFATRRKEDPEIAQLKDEIEEELHDWDAAPTALAPEPMAPGAPVSASRAPGPVAAVAGGAKPALAGDEGGKLALPAAKPQPAEPVDTPGEVAPAAAEAV